MKHFGIEALHVANIQDEFSSCDQNTVYQANTEKEPSKQNSSQNTEMQLAITK